MSGDDFERVAAAGYAVWRSASTAILPPWPYLDWKDRYWWREAARMTSPADIRRVCCTGLYICGWHMLEPDQQFRWRLVAEAMQAERGAGHLVA